MFFCFFVFIIIVFCFFFCLPELCFQEFVASFFRSDNAKVAWFLVMFQTIVPQTWKEHRTTAPFSDKQLKAPFFLSERGPKWFVFGGAAGVFRGKEGEKTRDSTNFTDFGSF